MKFKFLEHSKKRHILKSITWRVFGSLDTFILSFVIFGDPFVSLKISILESFTKLLTVSGANSGNKLNEIFPWFVSIVTLVNIASTYDYHIIFCSLIIFSMKTFYHCNNFMIFFHKTTNDVSIILTIEILYRSVLHDPCESY